MYAHKQKVGSNGENAAVDFLKEKGYDLVERNYRRSLGEIDIVCSLGKIIVFCEVKTRKSYKDLYFRPENNVDARKMQKLRKICEMYLLEKRYPSYQKWRIDVVSVSIDYFTQAVTIDHIEDAVWEKQYW